MITFEGNYFDGRHPVNVPARVDFSDREAALAAGPISEIYPTNQLRVSPRIGSSDRFITFPNGGQFACADHAFLDSLPQESRSEGPVAWLEARWGIALASVAIIFCTLSAGYFFGLPAAAERIAARIPVEVEQSLGKQTLAWFDQKGWIQPTNIDVDARKAIGEGFKRLCKDLPLQDYYQLEFRSSKVFGPNAFALPGGIIVITDEMVKEAANVNEVLALLAHEIGHVELHHTMRSILQNSVIGAAVAVVTSDAATLSAAVVSLPVIVARTKYSRGFEAAADDYAFKLLKQKGYSPADFASIMERLSKKEKKQMGAFAYISSHPMTAERVQRARAAAMPQASISQNDVVDEGRPPLSLTEKEMRSLLVGTWFGDERTKKGGRLMWIVQRKDDGTYEVRSRLADASGKRQDTTAVGDWGIEGDIFFSTRTGVLKDDKVVAADPANPYKRNDFRVLNLTREIFEFQRTGTNSKSTVRRVPADFDFSAGGQYSVSREGFTKEFSYILDRDNEIREGKSEHVVGPKTNLNGIEVSTTIIKVWKSGDGPFLSKHFWVENDEGVKSIAHQGPFDKSPKTKEQDSWDLKYPLFVGKSWKITDEINSLKEKFTVPITYVVEAMDDVVAVSAGTFENCTRIKESFSGKVTFWSYGGEVEVTLENYRWYAPSLGCIKGLDSIKCSNPELGGGKSHAEMISYKN